LKAGYRKRFACELPRVSRAWGAGSESATSAKARAPRPLKRRSGQASRPAPSGATHAARPRPSGASGERTPTKPRPSAADKVGFKDSSYIHGSH